MAKYEHLPIYRKAFDLAVDLEKSLGLKPQAIFKHPFRGLEKQSGHPRRDVMVDFKEPSVCIREQVVQEPSRSHMMRTIFLIAIATGWAIFLPGRVFADRFDRVKHESSSDHYVTDEATGLMWQGCAAPLTGESCTGTAGTYTWQEALAYCEGLGFAGYSDWRLPNRRELLSITDDRKVDPAIDETVFPNTASDRFWTSSSYAGSSAWGVGFNLGYVVYYDNTNTSYVRCVRGGP